MSIRTSRLIKRKLRKKTTKKANKNIKRGIAKLIGFIGIPLFCFLILIVLVMGAVSMNMQKNISALSLGEGSGENLSISENTNTQKGSAKYVGVDDTDTSFSKGVIEQIYKYSNDRSPYFNGYAGYCERFCRHTYEKAGLSFNRSCCATTHRLNHAKTDGKIPKGALIFSGKRIDGSMYVNGGNPKFKCSVCGNFSGHVAIYVGNGLVAGSQIPYFMSLDKFIDYYGYGGYSTQ